MAERAMPSWGALEWRGRATELDGDIADLEAEAAELRSELDALPLTLSWRATAWLRATGQLAGRAAVLGRRIEAKVSRSLPTGRPRPRLAPEPSRREAELPAPLRVRLAAVVELAGGTADPLPGATGDGDLLTATVAALAELPAPAAAWLAWTAATGSYPDDSQLDHALVQVELGGPPLAAWLLTLARSPWHRAGAGRPLLVVRQEVLVDTSSGSAPGDGPEPRELAAHWLRHPSARAVTWDDRSQALVLAGEAGGFGDDAAAGRASRATGAPAGTTGAGAVLVPWGSTVLVPGAVSDPQRIGRLRALARAKVAGRLGLVGPDLAPGDRSGPATAAYLSLVKVADRLVAGSEHAATGYRVFGRMLASQGLTGPEVAVHRPPVDAPADGTTGTIAGTTDATVDAATDAAVDAAVDATRRLLALDSIPVVVAHHEPGDTTAVLAAERLWRRELPFHLVVLAEQPDERLDLLLEHLRSQGRPVQLLRGADPTTRAAVRRLAALTVAPARWSVRPLLESLRAGTPAITSTDAGAAEVAAGGGAWPVEHGDVASLEGALHRLLTDPDALATLRADAAARPWPRWDEYANETWAFLTGG